jgi:hypothetical protein
MNITDLIVEFIQQGNVVEFPGMGTLTSSNVNAYHDAATSIYYPARRTVVMTETLAGNKAVVRRIAERECVTNEIAEQMWANYVSALKDKLQHNPKGHEFPGIGCLRLSGSKVVFDALEGLDLDAGKKHEQPLENVATYTPKEVEDPFAAFEKPATPKPPVVEEPKPEPETMVMEAAFQKFKPDYQMVGENSFWHLTFSRDYRNEDTGETYDYYMTIYDNGAGNPGIEGPITFLDNKSLTIKVDFDLYEATPADWKLGEDTLDLEYSYTDDGHLILENSGSKAEFAEYVETEE